MKKNQKGKKAMLIATLLVVIATIGAIYLNRVRNVRMEEVKTQEVTLTDEVKDEPTEETEGDNVEEKNTSKRENKKATVKEEEKITATHENNKEAKTQKAVDEVIVDNGQAKQAAEIQKDVESGKKVVVNDKGVTSTVKTDEVKPEVKKEQSTVSDSKIQEAQVVEDQKEEVKTEPKVEVDNTTAGTVMDGDSLDSLFN